MQYTICTIESKNLREKSLRRLFFFPLGSGDSDLSKRLVQTDFIDRSARLFITFLFLTHHFVLLLAFCLHFKNSSTHKAPCWLCVSNDISFSTSRHSLQSSPILFSLYDRSKVELRARFWSWFSCATRATQWGRLTEMVHAIKALPWSCNKVSSVGS